MYYRVVFMGGLIIKGTYGLEFLAKYVAREANEEWIKSSSVLLFGTNWAYHPEPWAVEEIVGCV